MRLFSNGLYKLSAFLIACVLWAAAQGVRSVEESLDVPIAIVELPSDVVVVDQSAREVNVRVSGSRAALRRAEKELVHYPLSLAGMKPGEARVNVDIEHLMLPRGARVSARSPSTVAFRLDARASKQVAVRVDLAGEPEPGYRVKEVRAVPPEVTLEGASGELKKIRELSTDRVDVSGLRESAAREARLIIAATNVWRADGTAPVRVEIEIEAAEPHAAGPPAQGL
jgi:YbbR domain-containing protein